MIAILAILSALIVLIGATLALPSFVGFLRSGGWESIKIHFARDVAATAILIGATITLSLWAHQLSHYQRNGGDRLYSLAFLSWLLIFAIALAAWSWTVVTTARHISLTQRAIRIEGFLAQSVTALIAATTVAIAIWWVGYRDNRSVVFSR